MNRISPPFNDIKIPIISLGRSKAGAEVIRISTFICAAITPAIVVLPSPGGP